MVAPATAQAPVEFISINKEIVIAAPIEIAFEAALAELGPESEMPGGKPFPFTLEPWPGGRWFRDLGNNTGHLWGHVQVIKPPTLIEISGPMFMSFPAVNFLQYRLSAEGEITRLKFIHQAMGQIPSDVKMGVNQGWQYRLDRLANIAKRIKGT